MVNIVWGVFIIIGIVFGIFNGKVDLINNEVITEEMTSNNNEVVFPEGFIDEGLDFDYNLVIMEELNVE